MAPEHAIARRPCTPTTPTSDRTLESPTSTPPRMWCAPPTPSCTPTMAASAVPVRVPTTAPARLASPAARLRQRRSGRAAGLLPQLRTRRSLQHEPPRLQRRSHLLLIRQRRELHQLGWHGCYPPTPLTLPIPISQVVRPIPRATPSVYSTPLPINSPSVRTTSATSPTSSSRACVGFRTMSSTRSMRSSGHFSPITPTPAPI